MINDTKKHKMPKCLSIENRGEVCRYRSGLDAVLSTKFYKCYSKHKILKIKLFFTYSTKEYFFI